MASEGRKRVRNVSSFQLQHGKDGRSWWSHKTAEGWGKGK